MRPETGKQPTARFRAAAPPAWARGPAADGRAAETARAARPLGLLLAWLAGGRPQTVGSNPTAGRQSRSSKTGGASPQNPNRPFLLPLPVSHAPASGGDADGGRRQGKVVAPPWLPRRRATLAQRARGRRDGHGWRPCSGSGPGPETTARRRPATGFLCARRRAVTRAVVLDRER